MRANVTRLLAGEPNARTSGGAKQRAFRRVRMTRRVCVGRRGDARVAAGRLWRGAGTLTAASLALGGFGKLNAPV